VGAWEPEKELERRITEEDHTEEEKKRKRKPGSGAFFVIFGFC
jgi:hypothetical protein